MCIRDSLVILHNNLCFPGFGLTAPYTFVLRLDIYLALDTDYLKQKPNHTGNMTLSSTIKYNVTQNAKRMYYQRINRL